MLNNKCVGAVIRDIATKDIADYYGHKLKLTVEVYFKLNHRQVRHPDDGKLSAYGLHAVFLSPEETSSYVYEEKNIDSHKKIIYDEVGDSFGKWLYQNASYYLPWTTN